MSEKEFAKQLQGSRPYFLSFLRGRYGADADIEDALQECNIILWECVRDRDKYPTYKFNTLLWLKIRQYFTRKDMKKKLKTISLEEISYDGSYI
ncbi:MAG: sigma-70 family RNA polymerase sigma factor [Firmicutes bacterium]|nr:sigma-70 family RNA polymerase sigma factor [Bacillota bacterium]